MLTEFTGNLTEPLKFGHCLEIVGRTKACAQRFDIDLCTEKTAKNCHANIGLRIYCNLRENFIARSSRLNNKWGREETFIEGCEPTRNPIVPGDFFRVYILCHEDRFYISINNQTFCSYKYRLPIATLRALEIHNDIEILKQIDHRTVFPIVWPTNIIEHFDDPNNHWDFSNDIPLAFKPGHIIIIDGRAYGNKHRFSFNFVDREALQRILFHFDIRFHLNHVAINHMDGCYRWVHEQHPGGFPFVFNQPFKLVIAFCENEVKTAVDGKIFSNYKYPIANIFQRLLGFKLRLEQISVKITNIDHIQLNDSYCEGFEKFSNKCGC